MPQGIKNPQHEGEVAKEANSSTLFDVSLSNTKFLREISGSRGVCCGRGACGGCHQVGANIR
jgi:hypothetical protein